MWWQTWTAIETPAKRRKLGFQRAKSGQQRAPWERPFVTAWGVDWRSRLEKCPTFCEWMHGYRGFAGSLCKEWGLPAVEETRPFGGDVLVKVSLPTSIHDPPLLRPTSKETCWDVGGPRLWIQTDNQQVARAFAGQSALQGDFLRPPCIRIAHMLQHLLALGFRPRRDIAEFIEWDPREYNGVADHAANCALDVATAWELGETSEIEMSSNPRIRLCVDGARRGNGQASGGMAVLAHAADGSKTYVQRGGVVFGCLDSAFSAEVLAMEWALESLIKYFVAK